MMLEDAPVEKHLREAGEVGRGTEEAGVRCYPAHRKGVLIVHFAAKEPAAPGVDLGRGDAGEKLGTGPIERVPHSEGLERDGPERAGTVPLVAHGPEIDGAADVPTGFADRTTRI